VDEHAVWVWTSVGRAQGTMHEMGALIPLLEGPLEGDILGIFPAVDILKVIHKGQHMVSWLCGLFATGTMATSVVIVK